MCTPVADSYGWTQVRTRGETNELPAPFSVSAEDLAPAPAAKTTTATHTAARKMKRFTGLLLLLSWLRCKLRGGDQGRGQRVGGDLVTDW